MLARRLTIILPALRLAEALETTCIHRVAGRTGARTVLVTTRPDRAPPQTVSDVGLIGGQVPVQTAVPQPQPRASGARLTGRTPGSALCRHGIWASSGCSR
jgi:predicted ATPase with chaperone activity